MINMVLGGVTALALAGLVYYLMQPAQAPKQDKPLSEQYKDFILMIVAYLRTIGLNETADSLLDNMYEAIYFLRQNNFTIAHMTGHNWNTNKRNHRLFGQITDGELKNTMGVSIYLNGRICIGHFNQDGFEENPKFVYL
jgi:hypothetical protein